MTRPIKRPTYSVTDVTTGLSVGKLHDICDALSVAAFMRAAGYTPKIETDGWYYPHPQSWCGIPLRWYEQSRVTVPADAVRFTYNYSSGE